MTVSQVPRVPRWMTGSDVNAVLDIDWECYERNMEREDLLRLLTSRGTIGICVPDDQLRVVGFCVYRLATEIEIIRMGVASRSRRCGYGTAMLDRIKSRLQHDRTEIVAGVEGHAVHAQLMFRSAGFIGTAIEDDIRFVFTRECDDDFVSC